MQSRLHVVRISSSGQGKIGEVIVRSSDGAHRCPSPRELALNNAAGLAGREAVPMPPVCVLQVFLHCHERAVARVPLRWLQGNEIQEVQETRPKNLLSRRLARGDREKNRYRSRARSGETMLSWWRSPSHRLQSSSYQVPKWWWSLVRGCLW